MNFEYGTRKDSPHGYHVSHCCLVRVVLSDCRVLFAHWRDPIPRHPRLFVFVPGPTYHVYCRLAGGELVFDEPNEVAEFVGFARQVRDLAP